MNICACMYRGIRSFFDNSSSMQNQIIKSKQAISKWQQCSNMRACVCVLLWVCSSERSEKHLQSKWRNKRAGIIQTKKTIYNTVTLLCRFTTLCAVFSHIFNASGIFVFSISLHFRFALWYVQTWARVFRCPRRCLRRRLFVVVSSRYVWQQTNIKAIEYSSSNNNNKSEIQQV